MTLPESLRECVISQSPFCPRLRIVQDDRRIQYHWSRLRDTNYLKLYPQDQVFYQRSVELQCRAGDVFAYRQPSFTMSTTGPDSWSLRKDENGSAYMTIDRLCPIKRRGNFTHKSRYPSYSGSVIDELGIAKLDRCRH